jgi:hypothetical protein
MTRAFAGGRSHSAGGLGAVAGTEQALAPALAAKEGSRRGRTVKAVEMRTFGEKHVAHAERANTCLRARAVLVVTAPAWLPVSATGQAPRPFRAPDPCCLAWRGAVAHRGYAPLARAQERPHHRRLLRQPDQPTGQHSVLTKTVMGHLGRLSSCSLGRRSALSARSCSRRLLWCSRCLGDPDADE